MSELSWNNLGERYFDAGVDRGVLYLEDGSGVPWNGLISVSESPSEGSSNPRYYEGVKYQQRSGNTEFSGTIEAYIFPREFGEYDGTAESENGFIAHQQKRKPFGLSYRTLFGNDISGTEHGYKIHVVYNVLAAPSDKNYESLSEDVEPLTFSWTFSTMAVRPITNPEVIPTSHVTIDANSMNATQKRFVEEYLYGSVAQSARIPDLDDLIYWFKNTLVTLVINQNVNTGTSPTVESLTVDGDLRGRTSEGKYILADNSRLVETSAGSGIYRLET
jgi:hypothetical protein